MSKIAIVTDTHFGARNDNPHLLQKQVDFFTKQFFPYLDKHGITKIIHCGDFFDKRKNVNISTLNAIDSILTKLSEYETHLVLGNHDVYYNNKNTVNSVSEILSKNVNFNSNNLHVYMDATDIELYGTKLLMLPWMNRNNLEHSLKTISLSSADYAFGHLEINGFELHHGVNCSGKLERSIFSKFKRVFSGHFHKQSLQGNIHYIGTPYHLTWGEYGNDVGFQILDTETGEIEFIKGTVPTLRRYVYTGGDFDIDFSECAGCFVKLINDSDDNSNERFDEIKKRIESVGVAACATVDTRKIQQTRVSADDLYLVGKKSTLDFLLEYTEKQEKISASDKLFVKEQLIKLFSKAKSVM